MRPDAVIDALRVTAVVLAAYLFVVTFAGVTLRLARAHLAAALVDRVTPALLRRVVASLMGASLGLPAVAAAQDAVSDPPVVMHRLDSNAPATTTAIPAPPVDDPPKPVPEATVTAPAERLWTVEPGQHFWSIAESVLAQAWSRVPTDAEVVPYWRQLIEGNRARLVDPANDDLIYPGQRFVVPPPATRS